MSKNELTEEAREARREYMRNWRRKNKEKAKQHQIDYWNRKAEKAN